MVRESRPYGDESKMQLPCPHCDHVLEYEPKDSSDFVYCPSCQATVRLPELKSSEQGEEELAFPEVRIQVESRESTTRPAAKVFSTQQVVGRLIVGILTLGIINALVWGLVYGWHVPAEHWNTTDSTTLVVAGGIIGSSVGVLLYLGPFALLNLLSAPSRSVQAMLGNAPIILASFFVLGQLVVFLPSASNFATLRSLIAWVVN